ncbi:MAG TPA: sensor histidine kinase [Bryobacteraceae bacterium]|nr:sensor histidine kinase [Bryobacteraceae bacterium]
MAVWADMLYMIGEKNNRLYSLLERNARPRAASSRSSGRTIVHELERERSRIARELHAGAGQPLAGIKLNLEMLVDCAAVLPEAGREALDRLQTLASQALEQVRSVSHSLHPPDWQGLTTEEAIRYLIQSSGLTGRLEVETHIDLPVEPTHTTKIAIYRCAQECISNVVRHSGATRFAVSVTLAGPAVELRLEDNGRGFPLDATVNKGIGLVAIREHAEALGGVCNISSNAEGVRICVQLPLSAD